MRPRPRILAFALIFLATRPIWAAEPANRNAPLNPQFKQAYDLGRQLYKRGDDNGAIDALTNASQLEPDLPKGYVARGICHLVKQRYDEALADFDEAHALGERTAKLFGLRGCCYLGAGQHQRGRQCLRKAIRLNPGDLGKGYASSCTSSRLRPAIPRQPGYDEKGWGNLKRGENMTNPSKTRSWRRAMYSSPSPWPMTMCSGRVQFRAPTHELGD